MPISKLLLIESEASLRDVLGACLGELGGWEVMASKSLQEGIVLCAQCRPDVILVDASTPESDALLLIEQLKCYSRHQAVPIVVISAKASWFSRTELHQMGFIGAISKPFDPSKLSAKIHQLMTEASPPI